MHWHPKFSADIVKPAVTLTFQLILAFFFYLRFHKNFVNVIASLQGRMISRTDPALRKTQEQVSNYRIHGPAEAAHANYSEAVVERDIRQIAAILVNDMEMSGPVFFIQPAEVKPYISSLQSVKHAFPENSFKV